MTDQPKGGFAKYAVKLIEQGYQIVPIKRGSKAPVGENWQNLRITVAEARAMASGEHTRSGVGILCRTTAGADLDLLDEKMALGMQAWIEENLGFAPVRIGMAPKRLLAFRAKTPFNKINSKTFIDPFGDPDVSKTGSGKPNGDWRKVEILGDGNQFVAYHIHPDTGRPYEWIGGQSPLTVPWEELPTLDQGEAQSIVDEFERRALEAGYTVKPNETKLTRLSGPSASRVDRDDVFAADKPKTEITDDELRKKLMLVPGSSDYDTWTQVGMALYHQYDGGDQGYQLWDEWSQTAENYDSSVLDTHWESFNVEGKGREPITARVIIKWADENARVIREETFAEIRDELENAENLESLRSICAKVKHIEFEVFQRSAIVGFVQKRFKKLAGTNLTLAAARSMTAYENPNRRERPRWLEGWVYVQRDKGFYNVRKRTFVSTEAFNASFGRFMLSPKDVLEGRSTPESPASAFALNNQQIETVGRTMYLPGEDDLFTLNGKPYVNTYDSTNVPPYPDKIDSAGGKAVAMAKGHLVHLFADVTDRTFLLDALAFLAQNPNRRLNFAILMQGVEEDGKSWFAGLMAAVMGPENVKNLQAQSLEEKFNGWAEGCQLVFVEEIKLQGHNRFDVLNKVKPLITNRMIPVRRMQTDTYDAINTASYMLTTNFRDALPLGEDDSRYYVMFSRFQTRRALAAFKVKDPTYYARLYGALEHGGALRKWLLDHQISPTFNPNERAPMSQSKREMIELAKTDESSAFDEIMSGDRPGLDDYILSTKHLADAMAELGVDVPYGRAMNALITSKGFSKVGRMHIGEEYTHIWSKHAARFRLRNQDEFKIDVERVRAWIMNPL